MRRLTESGVDKMLCRLCPQMEAGKKGKSSSDMLKLNKKIKSNQKANSVRG